MPLAEAMRDAGHDVTFASGDRVTPPLRELGFQTVAVLNRALESTPAQEAVWAAAGGAAEMPGPEVIAEAVTAAAHAIRTVYFELLPFVAQVQPDLIVYEDATIGAGLTAAEHGVPSVAVSSFLLGTPGLLHTATGDELAALWTDPKLRLDTRPPGFGDDLVDVSVPRLPMRPVAWDMPDGEVLSFAHQRPLVYVTLGEHDRLRAVIDGLAGLPVDVLAGVDRQDVVLPHVDVVIHQGDSRTTTGCLAHGVPQLALPRMADQFQNALAIDLAGAGISIQYEEVTTQTVADAVRELLDSETYLAASAKLREAVAAMPSPEETVMSLEAL